MPHQEAKLDEKQIALLIEKLRIRNTDEQIGKDVLEVLSASIGEDHSEPSDEIAKTICEILEPERLGSIVWMTCKVCRERLAKEEVEKQVDTCFSCRVGTDKGSCW